MIQRSMTRLFLGAVLLVWTTASFAADWPQWRGPARDGISKETGLLKSWPAEGPKVVWETKLGPAASAVAVVGGRVYTMYQDAKTQYGVALDEKTGNKLWEYAMGAAYAKSATGPRATPTVDGDKVYFHDALGNLACLTLDGKELWKVNTLELAGAKPIPWNVANSPFISGDMLVVNPGGKDASIVALDKKTGKVIWKSMSDVAGYCTPVEMKVGGVDSLVLLTGESVCGVAAKDGKPLWRYPWPNKGKINVPAVVVDGDKVFATTGYGIGCVLLQIVPEGGNFTAKEVWPISKDMQCRYGNPILFNGYYYGTNEKKFTCIDPKTGKATWAQDGYGYAAFSIADGLAYIIGEKGNFALAKLTPEKFELISEVNMIPVPGAAAPAAPAPGMGKGGKGGKGGKKRGGGGAEPRWTMPTIVNGKCYIRDDQRLLCLDVKAQ